MSTFYFKKHFRKFLFAAPFILFFAFAPSVRAGVLDYVTLTCQQCGNCTLNDFLVVGNNIFNFFLDVLGGITLLYIVFGGVYLLISHGSSNLVSSGTNMIKGAFVGLAICVCSWLIVNFIVNALVGGRTIFGKEWFGFGNTVPTECVQPDKPSTTTPPPSSVPVSPTNWRLRGINPLQVNDASAELTLLINCMYAAVPDMQINSISDDDVYTGRCNLNKCNRQAKNSGTCSGCEDDSKCVHTCGSCHYGYGTEAGTHFSQGVDLYTTSANKAALEKAANDCQGKIINHGTHLHVSTQVCPGR